MGGQPQFYPGLTKLAYKTPLLPERGTLTIDYLLDITIRDIVHFAIVVFGVGF